MQAAAPASDLYARRVRMARLSVSRGAPARRLAFALEESLRLVTLPGENEGRSYYFRRLDIHGLPPDGDRRVWLEAFQGALLKSASSAVPATHPRAGDAAGIYFEGESEALEILLHRLIAGLPVHEWFWPAVLERELQSGPRLEALPAARSLVPQIVEQLRARESSWIAVAIALFAAAQPLDVVRLLAAIPPSIAKQWLAEFPVAQERANSEKTAPDDSSPPGARLSAAVRHALARAAETFGREDVRTVWLATLAVLFETPSALFVGKAVSQAQRLLENSTVANQGEDPDEFTKTGCAGAPGDAPACAAAAGDSKSTNADNPFPCDTDQPGPASETSLPHERRLVHPESATSIPQESSEASSQPATSIPRVRRRAAYHLEGASTNAAGLFFLLVVLDRLGIAQAAPNLAVPILQRFAAQTGAASDDPVALWLAALAQPAPLPQVRAWCLAVHRYIRLLPRRMDEGPITAREIVNRTGRFAVNRTDLDVTLPLDAVDIRIRRAGLDLDPGWLPWFGRVIRFHYV